MSREHFFWALTTVAKVVKTFGCIEDSAETLDEFRYGEGGYATGGRRFRHGWTALSPRWTAVLPRVDGGYATVDGVFAARYFATVSRWLCLLTPLLHN